MTQRHPWPFKYSQQHGYVPQPLPKAPAQPAGPAYPGDVPSALV